MGFVLYGGTAIALRLGHRESLDFDFFIDRPFLHQDIFSAIPTLNDAVVTQETHNTLTLGFDPDDIGENSLHISFFQVGVGRVGRPEWTSDGEVLVASMDDLLASKLKVILQRIEKKDYLDIYAMLRAGQSLERGLSGAKALFGKTFQPNEALKALTYFEGGDLGDLLAEVKKALISAVNDVQEIPPTPLLSLSLDSDAP